MDLHAAARVVVKKEVQTSDGHDTTSKQKQSVVEETVRPLLEADVEDVLALLNQQAPHRPESVLALNEAYSEVLQTVIHRIEKALENNRRDQRKLETVYRKSLGHEASMKKKVPVAMFLPPYFKDQNNMVAPLNDEARAKLACMVYDPLMKEEKKWTNAELKKLREAVGQLLLANALAPLAAKREAVADRMKMSGVDTTDGMRAEWRNQLEKFDREMAHLRNMPLEKHISLNRDNFESIDWARISNADFKGSRSAQALRLKWMNEQNPIYSQEPWKKDELERLRQMGDARGSLSWQTIAERLGTRRTAWQCFEKYRSDLSADHFKREWTREEDERLVGLVNSMKNNGVIQWDKVTYHMEGRTRQQCRTRYLRTLDDSVKHGRWTEEEDLMLMCSIGRYGAKNWRRVAQGVPGRSDAQCRERWVNVLDRYSKGTPWTVAEDEKLIYAVSTFGKGEWTKISAMLEGRAPGQCRARFRSLLTSKMRLCSAQVGRLSRAHAYVQAVDDRAEKRMQQSERRRELVHAKFNALIGGPDATGREFSRLAALTVEKRPNSGRTKQLTEEEHEKIREAVADIERRHRENPGAVDRKKLIAELPISQDEVDRQWRQLLLRARHRRPMTVYTRGAFDPTEGTRRHRPLILADSCNIDVNFGPDVPEDERVMRLTEALCQALGRLDDRKCTEYLDAPVAIERVNGEVHEVVKKILLEGVDTELAFQAENRLESHDPPRLQPNKATLNALEAIKADRIRLQQSAYAFFDPVDYRPGMKVQTPTSEHDRMNILLSSEIMDTYEFKLFKETVSTLLSESLVADVALSTRLEVSRRREKYLRQLRLMYDMRDIEDDWMNNSQDDDMEVGAEVEVVGDERCIPNNTREIDKTIDEVIAQGISFMAEQDAEQEAKAAKKRAAARKQRKAERAVQENPGGSRKRRRRSRTPIAELKRKPRVVVADSSDEAQDSEQGDQDE